eukprot:TRINITY_DN3645_c0_g5_i2.p1 TRINITY_DN3645_c0_g5~~TRINITY_DN3645_c0_g5_i2.p1  ORF type:complete len:300 (+),score=51.28 TRINITY_DN3645_c0_g5_i2:587-1486(+)
MLYMEKSIALDSLTLRGIRLKYRSWKFLSRGIFCNNSLRILKINYIPISLKQFSKLASALYRCQTIEVLDLSNNWLKDSYSSIIRKILSSQTERRDEYVWCLSLRNEKPKGIAYRKGLHTLALRNNEFTDKLVIEVSQTLKHDTYLLALDLGGNRICSEGMQELVEILHENRGLISVDVNNNPGYNEELATNLTVAISKNAKKYKRIPEMYKFIIDNGIATAENFAKFSEYFEQYEEKRKRASSIKARNRFSPQKPMKRRFAEANANLNDSMRLRSEEIKRRLFRAIEILDSRKNGNKF